MDYKALFEEGLLKLPAQHRQAVLSNIAVLEFEVEPYSYAELYDGLKELNEQLEAEKAVVTLSA